MKTDDVRVRDVMVRELLRLKPDERLHLANDLMQLGRVRHIPVVDDGRVVGIVTERDLFRAGVSAVLRFRAEASREWLEHITVSDVMVRDVVTAAPDWPMSRAVEVMLDRQIGCLPVVEDGKLLGLVTETDCLRLLQRLLQPPVAPAA